MGSFDEVKRLQLAALNSKQGEDISIEYEREVMVTTELLIRHGRSLKIRNMKWLVSTQELSEPLLGRLVLETLGTNTERLIASASDAFEGSADADTLLEGDEQPTGSLARLIASGIFHSDHGIGDHVESKG